jgi:membrane-associated protein
MAAFLHLGLSDIMALLIHYKYGILFPLSVIEGPVVSIISGFLITLGYLNLILTFFVLVIGDVVGDFIYYALGRWAGRTFINYFGKYVGVTEKRVHSLEHYFYEHDWKILFFGKTQAIGSAILFTAGVTRMPFARYMFFNLIASIPKVILFLVIGYYFGKAYATVNTYVNYFAIASLALSIVLLSGYLFLKRYIKKTQTDLDV